MKCFDRALKIDPEAKRGWNNKGLLLEKLGRFEEALMCYENALKIDPEYEEADKNRKILLENVSSLISKHDKILEENPKDVNAWKSKGALLACSRKLQ
jgi:tetratricopeptide (TPR) repeat protein